MPVRLGNVLCEFSRSLSGDCPFHLLRAHVRLQGENEYSEGLAYTRISKRLAESSFNLYVHPQTTVYAPRSSDSDEKMYLGCSV